MCSASDSGGKTLTAISAKAISGTVVSGTAVSGTAVFETSGFQTTSSEKMSIDGGAPLAGEFPSMPTTQSVGTAPSWGKYPITYQKRSTLGFADQIREKIGRSKKFLAIGRERSYGDCCLNDGSEVVETKFLDNIISFDRSTGIIEAQAGIRFKELIAFLVPRGYFVPVTPGTQLLSLGGAVANDVHGKNHHVAGNFGHAVQSIKLHRSDRAAPLVVSRNENSEFFAPTVGGIGLTGFMESVTFKARPVETPLIAAESIQFKSLSEFVELSTGSDGEFEHTVAWLDCLAGGDNFGRGLFMRGNHAKLEEVPLGKRKNLSKQTFRQLATFPISAPDFCLNQFTMKAFNELYYRKQFQKKVTSLTSIQSFFHPLDAVGEWNRVYGKRGFFQFQCALPQADGMRGIEILLKTIVKAQSASFLAVLKFFGDKSNEGILSFPMQGPTLALDFPMRGENTIRLMKELEAVTNDFGGKLYTAKDALMSAESFQRMYPHWQNLEKVRDPKISSTMWKRLTGIN